MGKRNEMVCRSGSRRLGAIDLVRVAEMVRGNARVWGAWVGGL